MAIIEDASSIPGMTPQPNAPTKQQQLDELKKIVKNSKLGSSQYYQALIDWLKARIASGVLSGQKFMGIPMVDVVKAEIKKAEGGLTKALNKELIQTKMDAANQFAANMPQYISQQTSDARSQLGQELKNTVRDIRGTANSRGMLFSGQRIGAEGAAAGDASTKLASMRGDIIRGALDRSSQMFSDPLIAKSAQKNKALQAQLGINQAQQQLDQQQQQGLSSGMGLIGSGVGYYLGNQSPQSNKPKTGQTPSQGAYTQQPSNYFG